MKPCICVFYLYFWQGYIFHFVRRSTKIKYRSLFLDEILTIFSILVIFYSVYKPGCLRYLVFCLIFTRNFLIIFIRVRNFVSHNYFHKDMFCFWSEFQLKVQNYHNLMRLYQPWCQSFILWITSDSLFIKLLYLIHYYLYYRSLFEHCFASYYFLNKEILSFYSKIYKMISIWIFFT